MSAINITNVTLTGQNPSPGDAPLALQVTFEALEELRGDIEWRLTYVVSAGSEEADQDLDEVVVGPIRRGQSRFTLETAAPVLSNLDVDDLLSYHALLLSGFYNGHEFVRIGYYVQHGYEDQGMNEQPPMPPRWDQLKRLVYADEARMTKFVIAWDDKPVNNENGGEMKEGFQEPEQGGGLTLGVGSPVFEEAVQDFPKATDGMEEET